MLTRTFQHIPGVGPWLEKDLWARGILTWDDFPKAGEGVGISAKADDLARTRIDALRAATEAGDLTGLSKLIPAREHWRAYDQFADEAVFFDIECNGREEMKPTVVSLLDRDGIHVFLEGRNMQDLPAALGRRRVWVTFNGSVFDVPTLKNHFPELKDPDLHLDLRFIFRKLGMPGGLKSIEEALGLQRPLHLKGANGYDAVLLWRAYQRRGDMTALRFLVEYNLYDAFNLKTLMDEAYNRLLDDLNHDLPKRRVFEKGDVLYDVSRYLLELSPTPHDEQTLARVRAMESDP